MTKKGRERLQIIERIKVATGSSREIRGEHGTCGTNSAHGANQDRAHRMVSSARDITFSVDEGIQNRPNRKWQYLVVTVVMGGRGRRGTTTAEEEEYKEGEETYYTRRA